MSASYDSATGDGAGGRRPLQAGFPRIVVADRDASARGQLVRLLRRWGHEVVEAASPSELTGILQHRQGPDILLLDWNMPGVDPGETCRQLRAPDRLAGAPRYVLALMSRSDRASVTAALADGADDFLARPLALAELDARLRVASRVLRLESQVLGERERAVAVARYDELTGLWNRRAVLEHLSQEIVRARCSNTVVGVMVLDIDHLGRINDQHGHQVGDAVLVEAAARMRANIRVYDGLGRWGGEEFLVVGAYPDAPTVGEAAERVRRGFVSRPVERQALHLPVTASIGVATSASGGYDAERLVGEAGEALFAAKTGGRNQVAVAKTGGGAHRVSS